MTPDRFVLVVMTAVSCWLAAWAIYDLTFKGVW